MKRKMKRYSGVDGESEVIDMREDTSQPTGIDDSVRARAMKFLQTGKKEEEASSSTPRASVKKVTKTVVEDSKEPKNFRVPEEKGLETVSPELDLLPIGKVAGALGAGYLGARALGKHILGKRAASEAAEETAKKAAERVAKSKATREANKTRRSEEGYSPDEALKAIKKNAERSDKKRAQAYDEASWGSFKKGGSVSSGSRTSASKRADGIATKGFTRACGGGYMKGKK